MPVTVSYQNPDGSFTESVPLPEPREFWLFQAREDWGGTCYWQDSPERHGDPRLLVPLADGFPVRVREAT